MNNVPSVGNRNIISVLLCTHNPRPDYLRRVFDALKAQTMPLDQWELILIDNASTDLLAKTWDLSWHPRGRHVREDEIGLTAARLRGIKEAGGEFLVFVDDDNLLSPDFLLQAVALFARHTYLSVIGAGILEPEFEAQPPPELIPHLALLALRSVPSPRWSNSAQNSDCIPWGAGLCVTRRIANVYQELVDSLKVTQVLDRRGHRLFCGGDDLFAWAAARKGEGFGLFPELRITHLILAKRLKQDYFLRLKHDHSFSHGVLRYLLAGIEQRRLGFVRCVYLLIIGAKKGQFEMRIEWATSRGEDRAARFISQNGWQNSPTLGVVSTGESRGNDPARVPSVPGKIAVALLTGGDDKPYALGMASALSAQGISVDFIGSDTLDVPEIHRIPSLNFINARGDQRTDVNLVSKVMRIMTYYLRLARYAATARPKIFHILWNNKFEFFDRTLLIAYYKLVGKRVVMTAHNVNAGKRDSNDTFLNRLTLRAQYHLMDHVFVHTAKMKQELFTEFGLSGEKVSVIPYGIDNTMPITALTALEAKQKFGLSQRQKTLLFFGNIAPYKGLEYLVAAFADLVKQDSEYRLIIAGRPKRGCEPYWEIIREAIARNHLEEQIIQRIQFIPEERIEEYFKAADVLVLPYTYIFQSGVLFASYSFGLPVIASDVGSMKESIIEGRTGFVCRAHDGANLAEVIQRYFQSKLFEGLEEARADIREFANERHSWTKVGEIMKKVYSELVGS
jgi:glycosyltransferase involved in cell wall biosynthesis